MSKAAGVFNDLPNWRSFVFVHSEWSFQSITVSERLIHLRSERSQFGGHLFQLLHFLEMEGVAWRGEHLASHPTWKWQCWQDNSRSTSSCIKVLVNSTAFANEGKGLFPPFIFQNIFSFCMELGICREMSVSYNTLQLLIVLGMSVCS